MSERLKDMRAAIEVIFALLLFTCFGIVLLLAIASQHTPKVWMWIYFGIGISLFSFGCWFWYETKKYTKDPTAIRPGGVGVALCYLFAAICIYLGFVMLLVAGGIYWEILTQLVKYFPPRP